MAISREPPRPCLFMSHLLTSQVETGSHTQIVHCAILLFHYQIIVGDVWFQGLGYLACKPDGDQLKSQSQSDLNVGSLGKALKLQMLQDLSQVFTSLVKVSVK